MGRTPIDDRSNQDSIRFEIASSLLILFDGPVTYFCATSISLLGRRMKIFPGFLVHLITIGAWLLGGFFVPLPIVLWYLRYYTAATILTGLLSIQYLVHIPKWPGFAKWLQQQEPRSYYRRCELRADVSRIKPEKTLLCYHPHGILCGGFSWNGVHAPELHALGFVWLIFDGLVNAPIFGWIAAWCGNMQGASVSSMKKLMAAKRNLAIIPGGFEEATFHERGVERVYIMKRKGFIKYALRHGYQVCPVYTFGESETYESCNWFLDLRAKLNEYKIPTVLFFGWWAFPFFPRPNCDIVTIIGAPIDFPELNEDSITPEVIDQWHRKYVNALVELFDKHKEDSGVGHRQLDIR